MHDDTFLTALAGRFDAHEEQLRAVALRITGSPAETEAALAAARADLGRDDGAAVRAWLTAAVGRACVRGLQERGAEGRPERSDGGGRGRWAETAGAGAGSGGDSRRDVDSLWLALLVMLERLGGDERLAYVLHDVFGLPPYETARIIGCSPDAAARLARRARERLRGGGASRTRGERGWRRAEGEHGWRRAVVDRFLAAARA
ncbi:hypothetical protein GCM10010275_64590 [Streptomyces litmocidini]|uniref:sigma factor-like helix-turn-helix DNA-binding protein n=1 Tax=Streptomyces litmocidini TaxID=67318 RepID=UPI0019B3E8C9|nr:sigma factor-like helix-turn-helix DNA-binding protein [Streptomyces litmocidini]GGV14400.1 hypothetical protein GCM10010275_64590 [Streptomyces litmocidini]